MKTGQCGGRASSNEVFMDQRNLDSNTARKLNNKEIISESESWIFDNRVASETSALLENHKWLTTGEAAQYLRVSVGSVKNMIYRGQLRPRKLGRRNRFLREELDRIFSLSPTKKGEY
ncbi:MAG: helix-turn-helix domain-containing protein [Bdellovibrionales bacterium]